MTTRAPIAPGEFYHIYNRGTDKRKIFLTTKDYERFLALLYLANNTKPVRIENILRGEQGSTLLNKALEYENESSLVSLTAYCLMPNHFHLLLRARSENGVGLFMQKLTTAYTMYFNIKNDRTGALFQGKFKSRHIDNDRYLKYLLAYIHLNPKDSPSSTYAYSSYLDFSGKNRPQCKILDKHALPDYFPTPAKFETEMREWLSIRDKSTDEQGSTLLKEKRRP